MELTDDMLRRLTNIIGDLWCKTRALEIIVVEQLGRNPQELERLLQEARESPEFWSWRDQVFEELKGDH
jgi:hypothetical protein